MKRRCGVPVVTASFLLPPFGLLSGMLHHKCGGAFICASRAVWWAAWVRGLVLLTSGVVGGMIRRRPGGISWMRTVL